MEPETSELGGFQEPGSAHSRFAVGLQSSYERCDHINHCKIHGLTSEPEDHRAGPACYCAACESENQASHLGSEGCPRGCHQPWGYPNHLHRTEKSSRWKKQLTPCSHNSVRALPLGLPPTCSTLVPCSVPPWDTWPYRCTHHTDHTRLTGGCGRV